MGKYVGIDLGTTFSAVAYIDDKGNPQIIPNQQGENTTPSVVLFNGKKPVVGSPAKKKSVTDPGNYEAFVKRHMGEKTYNFTDKSGESYRPEEISGIILGKLKEDAEKHLGEEILGAVITVPAYFADPQRQATKDAAKMAGIPVLDVINEPTAAAIAFGIKKDVEKKQKIMIYDFGGGTFDVSILDIDSDNITVLATNGDHKLGGFDIDMAIYNYVVEQASEEGINIESDIKAKQRLMLAAEEAKKELSASDEAEICITVKGEDFEITIDRETFEDDIADEILDATISVMERTMDEAHLKYENLDKILLVGGSTRIPAIANRIKELTEITPSNEVHPDEAVAIGAAFHAVDVAQKIADGTFQTEKTASAPQVKVDSEDVPKLEKNYSFQDVTSHGVGIVIWDSELDKERNQVILDKNTPIPAEAAQEFCTVTPYQSVIAVRVTSGEFEELNYVTIIGEAEMQIRPRENRVPLRVIVSCDRDAILHVRAVELDDNTDLGEITINRQEHNMTEEEVKKAANRIHKLNIGE